MTSWVRTDGSVRFFGIGSKCVLKRQVTAKAKRFILFSKTNLYFKLHAFI